MTQVKKELMAVDPGNRKSGWVSFLIDPDALGGIVLLGHGKEDNRTLRTVFRNMPSEQKGRLILEMPKASGMPTSNETFEACYHIGRFIECWGTRWSWADRGAIKLHICGRRAANDSNVRAALLDRFGGQAAAIGAKKCKKCHGKGWFGPHRPVCPECDGARWDVPPGPLHGVASDAWAALAVACHWADHQKVIHEWTVDPIRANGKPPKNKRMKTQKIKRKPKGRKSHGIPD